ncbi:MAG: hypothetical protein WDO74_26345 [Pseudomonadota bacterium]
MLLRRHDYNVNIAGGLPAAQLTSEYVEANGFRLPTRRTRLRARSGSTADSSTLLMVSIEISEVQFAQR